MRTNKGIAGIKALPSCKRHAMSPTLPTTRLAAVPRQIPKAVHSSVKEKPVSLEPSKRADDRRTPGHDESTPDGRRGILGSKDRNAAGLGTHANPHEQTADQELRPGLGTGGSNNRPQAEVAREKDDTSSSEIEVQRVRQPAADETAQGSASHTITSHGRSPRTRLQCRGQH